MFYDFSKQTSVHGLHIVGAPKLHPLERIFWVLMVAIAAAGAVAIAYSNWTRYQANPTVVSIQKDFRNWLNPFPAATGCFIDRVDKRKADKYIQKTWGVDFSHPSYESYVSYANLQDLDVFADDETLQNVDFLTLAKTWGVNSSHPSYDKYTKFVRTIANVNYANLQDLNVFADDETLQNVDFLTLVKSVHPKLTGTLVTFETKRKPFWTLIMSELGICFSVNSLFANYLALTKNDSAPEEQILRCHYLNGLCYARYDSDPELALKYYIHSYLEVVHATSDSPLVVHESEELEINYRMQETESSATLRYLSPSQRKCRFYDEPISDDLPVYSTSICYMVCRYKLALKLCNCRPFFYHRFEGKPCDLQGLLCLARHSEKMGKPPSEIGCDCPSSCGTITYFPQVPKITKWKSGYFEQRLTFRWALLLPTTKFLRDVLFGFEDLVGTLALFLGISFISAIETVFLVVENIYRYYKRSTQQKLWTHSTTFKIRT